MEPAVVWWDWIYFVLHLIHKNLGRASRPPQVRNPKERRAGTPAPTGTVYDRATRRRTGHLSKKDAHWQLAGSVYFVTWRLEFSQPELIPDESAVIISALQRFDGSKYELFACVVMHNHVHALVKPLANYRLQDLVQSWKSFTAHKFSKDYGRRVPIWQREYFDRIIRDEREFFDKAQYIINNPLKQWPEIEDYPWVWIKENLNP